METKKNKFMLLALIMLLVPVFSFATSSAQDDFITPFMNLLTAWMTGNVGLTISIVIMIISVVWGAFGGGFGVIGKGFVLSILVGGVIFFATKAWNLGGAFN